MTQAISALEQLIEHEQTLTRSVFEPAATESSRTPAGGRGEGGGPRGGVGERERRKQNL